MTLSARPGFAEFQRAPHPPRGDRVGRQFPMAADAIERSKALAQGLVLFRNTRWTSKGYVRPSTRNVLFSAAGAGVVRALVGRVGCNALVGVSLHCRTGRHARLH